MRKEHITYLLDPISKEQFTCTAFEIDGEHVVSGLLISPSSWYPIIEGVPRMLIRELKENLLQTRHSFFTQYHNQMPDNIRAEWQKAIADIPNLDEFLEHQKKTAESFAYEWKYIYKENDYEKNNFFHFVGPFITEKNISDKTTIDIGCGSGRFTKWAGLSGSKVSFGTDLGESVQVAYELTKDLKNICIVQANIYNMPFENTFDLAYSIGVLHHLPQPKQGFLKLPAVLKKGGNMVIWVYNRRHNARALYFYEPLRSILKKLPKSVLFKISYIPAIVVHAINQVTHSLHELGAGEIAKRIPFAYYANFPFNMKLNDAFDVLATPKSNYYYVEEIKGWFTDAHLDAIQTFEHPEAGITAIGIKNNA